MTLELTRSRRLANFPRISAVVYAIAATKCSGGKGRVLGDESTDNAQRSDEGDPVRVEVFGLDSPIDERPDGEVDEQVGVDSD